MVCAVTTAKVVKALRAGACALTATTPGNPTYAPLVVAGAIAVRA